MPGERSSATLRADLDAAVDALTGSDAEFLAEDVATLTACTDRWYGRLAVRAFEATAEESATRDDVDAAAAGLALLRAYHEGRTALLLDARKEASDPSVDRLDRSLLVGDYRFAAAFRALEPVDSPRRGRCFEVLVETACSLVTATARCYTHSDHTTTDLSAYAEETAGALGGAAARIGTTLAGVDSGRFVEFGRYVATARRLERFGEHDPDDRDALAVGDVDQAEATALDDAANRYRREAERAFRQEGRPAPLEPFLARVADGSRP